MKEINTLTPSKERQGKSPLRIALVTRRPYAGLRSFHRGLAFPLMTLLKKRGHEPVLFIDGSTSPGFQAPEGMDVELCTSKNLEESLARRHQEKPFDILHGLDLSALPLAMNKKKYGFCVTFDAQSTRMTQIFALMGMTRDHWTSLLSTGVAITYKFLTTYLKYDRKLLSLADGVFVGSQAQKDLLEWFYLYPPAKTHLLPLATTPVHHVSEGLQDELKSKWNITSSGPTLLFFASMKMGREYHALLQAFQTLSLKKPTARLLVVGQGPKMKDFERRVLDLALGQKVYFLGSASLELASEALSLSDIIINFQGGATGLEPQLLEAMSLGKVVLGSDVSPWANWIRDGRDGFALRMTHERELTSIFLELAQRPELREQMGLQAKERVQELLDPEALAEKIEGAFEGVLRRKRRKFPAPVLRGPKNAWTSGSKIL